MLAGDFTSGGEASGKTVTVVSNGARLVADVPADAIAVSGGGTLRVRGLEIRGGSDAYNTTTCVGASLELVNVTYLAGGVRAEECRLVKVSGSRFENSSLVANAIELQDAGLVVDRTTFVGDGPEASGGAFYAHITNCLITRSPTSSGAALQLLTQVNGAPTVESIVAGNTIIGGYVYCSNPSVGFTPRWFTGNVMHDISPLRDDSACRYNYNLVNPADFTLVGVGNITGVDPKFVDAEAGNFRLRLGSPAVDAGDPTSIIDHDLDGNVRPVDPVNDMGAYEYSL
jgi:hypothetical protein